MQTKQTLKQRTFILLSHKDYCSKVICLGKHEELYEKVVSYSSLAGRSGGSGARLKRCERIIGTLKANLVHRLNPEQEVVKKGNQIMILKNKEKEGLKFVEWEIPGDLALLFSSEMQYINSSSFIEVFNHID